LLVFIPDSVDNRFSPVRFHQDRKMGED